MSSRLLLASLTLGWLGLLSCSGSEEPTPQDPVGSEESSEAGLRDGQLAPELHALLELAFEAPSRMPNNPHLKNKARGQEAATQAALATQQFATAYRFASEIENWRKGACYADLAAALLDQDAATEVQWLLDAAMEVAEAPAAETVDQEWRRDRVRSKVAAVYLKLGLEDEAKETVRGLQASETTYFEQILAAQLTPEQVDQQLDVVPELIQSANFEQQVSILTNVALLHNGHYEDEARRTRAKEVLMANWGKLPVQVHIDLMIQMAEGALEHQDAAGAVALADEARTRLGGVDLAAEPYIAFRAQLAKVLARAEAAPQAIDGLDAAMAIYEAERSRLVDMFRAGVLRPVAEAYLVAGATERAEEIYLLALEEGALNPNSRPRALDLTETLASMVRFGFVPTAQLSSKIEEVSAGLGEPW